MPCDSCSAAALAYRRERMERDDAAEKQRIVSRARQLALAELQVRHRAEYGRIYRRIKTGLTRAAEDEGDGSEA